MLTRACTSTLRATIPSHRTIVVVSRRQMTSKYASLTREELESRLDALETLTSKSPFQAGPSSNASASSSTTPVGSTSQPGRPSLSSSEAVVPLSVVGAAAVGTQRKGKGKSKAFNFNLYPTRHIALLVAYQGWPYCGLAMQPLDQTLYPTVEGELLKALEKAKLIEEGKGWDGCEFSRCGRTDRGVSGAGQVVNLWVRTTRQQPDGVLPPDSWRPPKDKPMPLPDDTGSIESPKPRTISLNSPELTYVKAINAFLPPAIRVLAWSPASPEFSSRFSCQYRHYKYAFHRAPSPGVPPLDLDMMRQAADRLIGEHDFRNFCRLDGSKQIENHSRRVIKAWFEEHDRDVPAEVAGETSPSSSGEGSDKGMIVFNLVGTAFLWHQVRHIMAVLFLVGSRLESPSVITELLDIHKYPTRPLYLMADGLPLRLHECGYLGGTLDWRVGSHDGPMEGISDAEREIETVARLKLERQLEEAKQDAQLRFWQTAGALSRFREIYGETGEPKGGGVAYPIGGGQVLTANKYRKLEKLGRGDTVEAVNMRWREGKGKVKAEKLAREAEENGE